MSPLSLNWRKLCSMSTATLKGAWLCVTSRGRGWAVHLVGVVGRYISWAWLGGTSRGRGYALHLVGVVGRYISWAWLGGTSRGRGYALHLVGVVGRYISWAWLGGTSRGAWLGGTSRGAWLKCSRGVRAFKSLASRPPLNRTSVDRDIIDIRWYRSERSSSFTRVA